MTIKTLESITPRRLELIQFYIAMIKEHAPIDKGLKKMLYSTLRGFGVLDAVLIELDEYFV